MIMTSDRKVWMGNQKLPWLPTPTTCTLLHDPLSDWLCWKADKGLQLVWKGEDFNRSQCMHVDLSKRWHKMSSILQGPSHFATLEGPQVQTLGINERYTVAQQREGWLLKAGHLQEHTGSDTFRGFNWAHEERLKRAQCMQSVLALSCLLASMTLEQKR